MIFFMLYSRHLILMTFKWDEPHYVIQTIITSIKRFKLMDDLKTPNKRFWPVRCKLLFMFGKDIGKFNTFNQEQHKFCSPSVYKKYFDKDSMTNNDRQQL